MLYKNKISPSASIALIAFLAVAFAATRVTGMFGPLSLRWILPLGFCLMAIVPWVLLTREGRCDMGVRKPSRNSLYFIGVLYGSAAAFASFLLGTILYGGGVENWFVNIGNSYKVVMDTAGMSFWKLNLIFTIPAIVFSPIGEEIFFRGVLQKTLEQKFSAFSSTFIECGLFSLVHLCHHGVIRTSYGIEFMPIPAVLWMAQIFFIGWLFSWLRARGGSIFVAIISHSAFNLTMNFLIFRFLW